MNPKRIPIKVINTKTETFLEGTSCYLELTDAYVLQKMEGICNYKNENTGVEDEQEFCDIKKYKRSLITGYYFYYNAEWDNWSIYIQFQGASYDIKLTFDTQADATPILKEIDEYIYAS